MGIGNATAQILGGRFDGHEVEYQGERVEYKGKIYVALVNSDAHVYYLLESMSVQWFEFHDSA